MIGGFALYGASLHHPFVELDDSVLIYENPASQSFTWKNVKTVFTTYDPELYIPLTLLTFQFDNLIGGGQPFVFHLHSLFYHILNAWLMLVLLWMLTQSRMASGIAAAIFLVHPLHVEAVLWASARKDVLSSAFFLGSIILYLCSIRSKNRAAYFLSLLMFILGLLAKVSIIGLPVILLLIDWLEKRNFDKKCWIEKIPFFIIALVFGLIALHGKSHFSSLPFSTLALIGAKDIIASLQHFFWPLELTPIYAWKDPITIRSAAFFLPLIATLFLLIGSAFSLWRRSFIGGGILFFLVMLAPSFFNLIKGHDYYFTSDRYAYLPSIGILLILVTILTYLHHRFTGQKIFLPLLGSVFMPIVFGLSFLTLRQAAIWKNSETLSAHAAAQSPQSRVAHMWHGNALRDGGKFEEAILAYDAALLLGNDEQIHYNKALTLESIGDIDAAQISYEHAVLIRPSYALAWINLGRLFHAKGNLPRAHEAFEKARSADPTMAMAAYNLGVVQAEEGSYEAAIASYQAALKNNASLHDARVNLASALLTIGRLKEGMEELKRVLVEEPEHPIAVMLRQQLQERNVWTTE